MDFLTTLSNRFAHGHICDAEDPDDDTEPLLSQMDNYLKPSAKLETCKKSIEEDNGDNLIEMITQPRIKYDEPDEKKKDGDEEERKFGCNFCDWRFLSEGILESHNVRYEQEQNKIAS